MLLLGFALIPVSLVFILGGVYAAGWLVYGTLTPPYFFGALPLPAALYGVLVWPFIWGLTEQMTYNGYLLPRFQGSLPEHEPRGRSGGVRLVLPACRDAADVRSRSSWSSAAVAGAVLPFRDAVVPATSPAGSVRDRARDDGWRERPDGSASSAIEGMTRGAGLERVARPFDDRQCTAQRRLEGPVGPDMISARAQHELCPAQKLEIFSSHDLPGKCRPRRDAQKTTSTVSTLTVLLRRASAIQRVMHEKFAASSVLPFPVYSATSGYGHSGRVRTTSPPPDRGEPLYLDATI